MEIEFTKDFANFKKGDKTSKLDGILASRLVRKLKVAKYPSKSKTKKSKSK